MPWRRLRGFSRRLRQSVLDLGQLFGRDGEEDASAGPAGFALPILSTSGVSCSSEVQRGMPANLVVLGRRSSPATHRGSPVRRHGDNLLASPRSDRQCRECHRFGAEGNRPSGGFTWSLRSPSSRVQLHGMNIPPTRPKLAFRIRHGGLLPVFGQASQRAEGLLHEGTVAR